MQTEKREQGYRVQCPQPVVKPAGFGGFRRCFQSDVQKVIFETEETLQGTLVCSSISIDYLVELGMRGLPIPISGIVFYGVF